MARRAYTDELKATVMAALLQGQSIGHVAKEYKIPRGTVANWAGQVRNQNYNPVPTEKKERIGSLIIDNLEAELETMIAMQDVFKDKEWLKKQSASELAVLYGVLKDKNIRVLEALPDGDGEPGHET